MSLIGSYSRKILPRRQKIILHLTVSVCILAFTYTYLVINYMQNAMTVSVADAQPHIRLFLQPNQSVQEILQKIKNEKQVVRADSGILIEDDFGVVARHQPTHFGEKGKMSFSGTKHIQFIGYDFSSESYRPPVLLENVYSKNNRELAMRRPSDDPVRIMTDQRENEKKVNWCIISKNLTDIFPLGPSAFGDPFEVTCIGEDKKERLITFRTAGYLNDSPLILNNAVIPSVVYTKRHILEKNFSGYETQRIIDIVIKDRNSVQNLALKILTFIPVKAVETWTDKNPAAIPFLNGIKTTAFVGAGAIILLSIIGVGILISMLIMEKTKQLAILYAMGCNAIELRCLFLLVGIRVACVALIIGGVSGFLLAKCSIPFWNNIIENFCSMPNTGLSYKVCDIILFSFTIILSCSLASWIPTRQLVNADPINNLRSE